MGRDDRVGLCMRKGEGKEQMYNNRTCTKSTSHHKVGGGLQKIQGDQHWQNRKYEA